MNGDTATSAAAPDEDARTVDVLIVGAGPVGLACGLLLSNRGHRVTILERWLAPYPRPRAVHYDDEVARLFADAGIGEQLKQVSEPAPIYEWQNAERQTILRFDWSEPGPSGWPAASMFPQPDLEATLSSAAATRDNLTVLRGYEAMQLTDNGDRVEVLARNSEGLAQSFTAPWVIGCDGANSFVRAHMLAELTDLGFFYDWLIVDVIPHDDRIWEPTNLQVCDPARPTTAVSGGPGRRRWEFMRMPGETVEELNDERTAWQLLAPWDVTPDNCTLERHTVYTFQARWADQWRSGRLLLAGDSAHLMPPFAGQGMCSGIRDAANLAWKLDLVLRGLASPSLLDTYGRERSAHVQHAIGMSVELGKVICVTDAEQAAQRDAFMLSQKADPARILPPLPPSTLSEGVIFRAPDAMPRPGAGVLTIQARASCADREGLFDDVVGRGFVLAGVEDPTSVLNADQLAFLDAIGTRIVQFVPVDAAAPQENSTSKALCRAVDVDGAYLSHFAETGHAAFLARPDHYLFGNAETLADLPALVEDLRRQLLTDPAPGPDSGTTEADEGTP